MITDFDLRAGDQLLLFDYNPEEVVIVPEGDNLVLQAGDSQVEVIGSPFTLSDLVFPANRQAGRAVRGACSGSKLAQIE